MWTFSFEIFQLACSLCNLHIIYISQSLVLTSKSVLRSKSFVGIKAVWWTWFELPTLRMSGFQLSKKWSWKQTRMTSSLLEKKNTASFQLFNMSFYPFELEQQSLCCSLLCILICSPIRKTWEFQCSKFYWVLSGNQARPWGASPGTKVPLCSPFLVPGIKGFSLLGFPQVPKSRLKQLEIRKWNHRTPESQSVSCSVVSDSFRPHGLHPTRFICPWNFSGKNTQVGCNSLLQGIFLTQESNPGLLHCSQILYHLSHQESRHDS